MLLETSVQSMAAQSAGQCAPGQSSLTPAFVSGSALRAPCCSGLACPYVGGVCCEGSYACCPAGSTCLPTQPGKPAACAVLQPQMAPFGMAALASMAAPNVQAPAGAALSMPPNMAALPLAVQVQLLAMARSQAQAQAQTQAQAAAAAAAAAAAPSIVKSML